MQAGAAVIDITPDRFPVVVNGGFLTKTAKQAYDRLYARCLVLDDGKTRVALVVVDNCMLPRKLIDEAKELVPKAADIPPNRILVSATHVAAYLSRNAKYSIVRLGPVLNPHDGQRSDLPGIGNSVSIA